MLNNWLREALKSAGMTQVALAQHLESMLRRPYYAPTINNMISGFRKISADELLAIAEITGVPAPNSRQPFMAPVLGKVSAGAVMHLAEDAQGPFDEVEAPEGSPETTVAAIIEGDSLGPHFNGWLVFWDQQPRPPGPEMNNKICVVGLDDGRIMIKRLARGSVPGTWTLLSQFEPPIYDANVKWATLVASMKQR